jgi:hypothetical protein
MSSLVALSVSIGVLGGIATILYLNVGLLIWPGSSRGPATSTPAATTRR